MKEGNNITFLITYRNRKGYNMKKSEVKVICKLSELVVFTVISIMWGMYFAGSIWFIAFPVVGIVLGMPIYIAVDKLERAYGIGHHYN